VKLEDVQHYKFDTSEYIYFEGNAKNNAQMIKVLKKYVDFKGTQKLAASMLGITPQYLCDILQGRREVSENVAAKLGYDRVVSYHVYNEYRDNEK